MENTVLEAHCCLSNTFAGFVDVVEASGYKCLAILNHQNKYSFIQCCPDGPWHASSHKAVAASIMCLTVQDFWLLDFMCSLTDVFCFPWHHGSKGKSGIESPVSLVFHPKSQ